MKENFAAELPEKFTRNTVDLCGEIGERWLNDLPDIIKEISDKWQLEAREPFPNLSYNFVAPCICKGVEAVLKIGLPLENPEIFDEAKFLQITKGEATVKLLKSDNNFRALLLERLTPGANLLEVCRKDETQAIEIAVSIIRKLVRKPPPKHVFRRLDEWFDNFFEKAGNTNFPLEFQNKARRFYEELSFSSNQRLLIHGDLHHENILSATREPFLAIDPKGIVGSIGYEIAVFLNNHLWWLASETEAREKLDKAVRRFSESFAIAQNDLKKWSFAQIVLSAWWTFEENGENWERDLAFAEFWGNQITN